MGKEYTERHETRETWNILGDTDKGEGTSGRGLAELALDACVCRLQCYSLQHIYSDIYVCKRVRAGIQIHVHSM